MSGPVIPRARVHVQNDDYDVDGRRLFILERPWSVHAPGKAPIYCRRFSVALSIAVGLAEDLVRA